MLDKLNPVGQFTAALYRTIPGQERHVRFWRLVQRVLRFWPSAEAWALAQELKHKRLLWEEKFPNLVVTVGKNLMLDSALAGSSYTVTGPFIGLVSATSFSGYAAGDTMSSHSGWLEAGNANAPTYSGGRKTASWAAASGGSKSLGSSASFSITGAGTVKGCFMVYGSGAVSTIDNTGGTLFSAGNFTGGDRAVINGDTLNVSYTISL